MCTYIYIYIYKLMYVCMYVCMYACMHACMYVCMHVCVCVHLYAFLCCPLIESHMLIMCRKAPPTHGRHHCRAPLHDVHQVAAIRKASRIKRCIRAIQIRPSDFWRELETRLWNLGLFFSLERRLKWNALWKWWTSAYGRPTTKLEALVASDCSQYTSANWSVCCTKISFLRQIWLMKSQGTNWKHGIIEKPDKWSNPYDPMVSS